MQWYAQKTQKNECRWVRTSYLRSLLKIVSHLFLSDSVMQISVFNVCSDPVSEDSYFHL